MRQFIHSLTFTVEAAETPSHQGEGKDVLLLGVDTRAHFSHHPPDFPEVEPWEPAPVPSLQESFT